MRPTFLAVTLGAAFLATLMARAQVLSSPQYGVRPFVTPPPMTHPRVPSTHDKRMRGKVQAVQPQGRFIPLHSTPQPSASVRGQQVQKIPRYRPGSAAQPRQITYPTHLVTTARPQQPPRVKALPANGAVSVLGPRQIQYHTLYQNPTPPSP